MMYRHIVVKIKSLFFAFVPRFELVLNLLKTLAPGLTGARQARLLNSCCEVQAFLPRSP
jgi:hypothetical protein